MLEPAQIFDVSLQFANKRAQQRAEEDLRGYVCFVSLINSSFAPPVVHNMRAASHQVEWARFGVIVESLLSCHIAISRHFQ